jgi:putative autoinducer-2 (AI-2) aldolase
MAGGRKIPEAEALAMAYKAVQEGASGVDMGRNIFQSDCPEGMMQAVSKVVHENLKPQEAYELYQAIKSEGEK